MGLGGSEGDCLEDPWSQPSTLGSWRFGSEGRVAPKRHSPTSTLVAPSLSWPVSSTLQPLHEASGPRLPAKGTNEQTSQGEPGSRPRLTAREEPGPAQGSHRQNHDGVLWGSALKKETKIEKVMEGAGCRERVVEGRWEGLGGAKNADRKRQSYTQ